ncbi:MAG: TolC family protein, partial [Candidatus Kapaibacterium sp.]
MQRVITVVVFFFAIGFVPGLLAQSKGTPKVFTLDECLRIASEKNFGVRSALGQYEAQNASLVQAFGTFLPSLNASMGFTRQLNVEGGRTVNIGGQIITLPGVQPNSYSMNAIASYNLFNGFSRESNYRRAQRNLDAAELSLRRTRQSVSYQVRSQYLGVLRSMQVRKLRTENLELGRQELARSKAQLEAGRIAVAQVYSQEADLGSREFDVVSSENAENQS